jgi:hypothetical protein
MQTSTIREPRHRLYGELAILVLALTLLAPVGAYASGGDGPDAGHGLLAQDTESDGETRVEFVFGPHHYIFSCPGSFPAADMPLDELFANCTLLGEFFCFDREPFGQPIQLPYQRACDDHRRL